MSAPSPREVPSARVAQELTQRGYEDVHALHGGFEAWKRAGGTLERKPGPK